MGEKSGRRLLKTGIGGSIVAAICCMTPVLTFFLGILGLGAMTGYLDYILFPALAGFLGITIYAISRRRPGDGCNTCK